MTKHKSKLKEVAVILQGRGELTDKQKKFIADYLWPKLSEAIAEIANEPEVEEAMGEVLIVLELPEHREFIEVTL